jgi:hypothetical protein
MRENTTPSNRVSPKYPSLIRHARRASQCPVVGRALNWQGQPQLQLQFATSSLRSAMKFSLVGSYFCSFTRVCCPVMEIVGRADSHCICDRAIAWTKRRRRVTGVGGKRKSVEQKFVLIRWQLYHKRRSDTMQIARFSSGGLNSITGQLRKR